MGIDPIKIEKGPWVPHELLLNKTGSCFVAQKMTLKLFREEIFIDALKKKKFKPRC